MRQKIERGWKVTGLVLATFGLALLAGCGSGGSSDRDISATVTAPPYTLLNIQEKQITVDKWNQGLQKTAYGDGVYLVVYQDDRNNVNQLHGEDIWGTLLDQNMNVIREFPIFSRDGRDLSPSVVYDHQNKRFAVVWISYTGRNLQGTSVMSALVDLQGNVLAAKDLEITKQFGEDAMIRNTGSRLAVLYRDVWTTNDINIGSKVLKLAVMDYNLTVEGIYTLTNDSENGAKVAPLGQSFDCSPSECFVAYNMNKEFLRGGSDLIYGRTVSLADGALGPDLLLSDRAIGKASKKLCPTVGYGNGRYLVTWEDNDSPQGTVSVDLVGRFVDVHGTMGSSFYVSDFRWDYSKDISTGLNGSAGKSAIAYRESDRTFYVVWEDTRTGTPQDTGIFLRKITPDLADKRSHLINNMPQRQSVPDIVVGAGDRIFVSWSQSSTRTSGEANGYFSADVFALQY